jgi:hypothetical protein
MFMNYVQTIQKRSPLMKSHFLAVLLLSCASGAMAQTDVSAQIATSGLRATETALTALADPTPSDQFALGGVRFLAAIETALQTRYRTGLSTTLTDLADIPVLRLPIPENPAPEPFNGAVIETMFAQISTDMTGAIFALAMVDDTSDVKVVINTADVWFDINNSGRREAGEGLIEVTGMALNNGFALDFAPVIRFDTADAAWLSAYAHLLAGVSETVLAFGPAEAIDKIRASIPALAALNPRPDPNDYSYDAEFGNYVDIAAMVLGAIEGQPDVTHSRAAHAHFLAMIDDNQLFWTRVAHETDNEAEWIPNKRQDSALGFEFPADTGAVWLRVLADAKAVLNGDLLIPHWRMGDGAGINLAMIMENPPPVDLIGMIQGVDLLPYAQTGRLISWESLARFDQLVQGDAGLFMVILN